MKSLLSLEHRIQSYGATAPLDELVIGVNQIYHKHEAGLYNRRHPEIFAELENLWTTLLENAGKSLPKRKLRILDYGCGTGFAALQAIRHFSPQGIEQVCCYDLSPEMIEKCKESLAKQQTPVLATSSKSELQSLSGSFDLILTNSLLHHLPSPETQAEEFAQLGSSKSVWVAGHEPSRRFFQNNDCVNFYNTYLASHRINRLFNPMSYLRGALRVFRASPARLTANDAFGQGLFAKPIPASLISEIVDVHVPITVEDAKAGRGFDISEFARSLSKQWSLAFQHSYNFLGPVPETRVSRYWRSECRRMSDKFPDDGANFAAVWNKVECSEQR